MKYILLTAIMLSFTFLVKSQNKVEADAILGYWITEEGKSVVDVYKKDDGKYYAKIVWLKEPNREDGTAKLDRENPDESLRSEPIKGLEFMKGFVFDADDNEWAGSHLYDPESGNTYSGYMKLRSENLLDLRGYVGISILGRTSHWQRKPDGE